MKSTRGLIIFIFSIVWLVAVVSPLFPRGRQDRELARIDALLEASLHEEAIMAISEIARRGGENFDIAHERFRRMYSINEEYNRIANELIDTLLYAPENDERIVYLSSQLLDIDSRSHPQLIAIVRRASELADFHIARRRLFDIHAQGRSYLDRGESEAAFRVYLSGTYLFRDHFFAAGYGAAIEHDVIRETERINVIYAAFLEHSRSLGAIATELINIINSGELQRAPQAIARIEPAIDRFIALKHELYMVLDALSIIQEELIMLDPELGERNHVAFLSHVIKGRLGETIQEGMLGTFENYWKHSVGNITNAIIENAAAANAQALAAFIAGDYSALVTAMNRVEQYINLSPLFFDKKLTLSDVSISLGRDIQHVLLLGNYIHPNDVQSYLTLHSLYSATGILTQAASIAGQLNINRYAMPQWQAGTISAAAALNFEQQTINSLNTAYSAIEQSITNIRQNIQVSSFYDTVYIRDALNAIEDFYLFITSEQLLAAGRYYTIANTDLSNSLAARREELQRGRDYLDGHRSIREDDVEIIAFFPSEALGVFNIMLSQLSGDLERSNALLAHYTRESSRFLQDEPIAELHTASVDINNQLNSLRTQGLTLAETAQGRVNLAEAHRQDAERLYREAEAAFRIQNFDIARDRLQRSSERIVSSLEIQESAALRQLWDNRLLSLGESISFAENEMIIAEVRVLVDSARVSYFAGNFQQAEDSLLRARNRWRVTNTEENQEVLFWLSMVQGALTIRAGRTIPPTAPLFPEMSQLLSVAKINFDEGLHLINAGSRYQGLAKFAEARQLTTEVRLVFPFNQEAGVLELRIEQYTDPAGFNAAFEQRLRTAIAGTQNHSMEAFTDLQNLAEINPGWPGMAGIINQAEINMGFRLPPPNPANIARSRELTASANSIVEAGNTAMFNVALAQIDEAIALDPENAEAGRVRDRLLARMAVPGTIVLSSQDEDEYQRALRELLAGNTLGAFAIVERLMQNPRNRNVPKLVELQRRIRAIL